MVQTTKHTPEKWTAIYERDTVIVRDEDGRAFATVQMDSNANSAQSFKNASNLARIVCAPDTAARLDSALALNKELKDKLENLGVNVSEWLCEKCNVIHPPQQGRYTFHPCPTCGTAMTPTSPRLRESIQLRAVNKELVETLREILSHDPENAKWFPPQSIEAARAVLARAQEARP